MQHLRRRGILARVQREGFLSTRDIATDWDVSLITARRDIEVLDDAGLAIKIRGGVQRLPERAIRADIRAPEAQPSISLFATAADLAKPGMTIGIAAGYSAVGMARELSRTANLTIVTNSLAAAETLLQADGSAPQTGHILLLPGLLDSNRSTIGPPCVDALRELRIDITYVSASGFDYGTHQFSDTLTSREIVKAFASSTRLTVAVAPSTRWSSLSAGTLPASMFNAIVADFCPDDRDRDALAQAGSSLILAA
jgi:DeoR family fructose operon transcriptional repressor